MSASRTKTRVPTLATLQTQSAQQGAQGPPQPVVFASSGVFPAVQPAAQRLSSPAIATAPGRPRSPRQRGKPRRLGLVLGVVAGAVLLLAGGGFVAWRGMSKRPSRWRRSPTPPPVAPPRRCRLRPRCASQGTRDACRPTPPPTPPAASAREPSHRGHDSAEEPRRRRPRLRRRTRPRRAKPRPVTLGIDDVERVVAKGRARIASCFERYKADLPTDTGVVRVQLAIASSGKVKATTQGPLASKPVGQCLETQAEHLRFPAHRDQEVNVVLPFDYTVKR